jgi:hypothetical protein
MGTKVCGIDELKVVKIAKLNMRGKSKDLVKKSMATPMDW